MRTLDGNVVTCAKMKEIERSADEAGLSYGQMMENAGSGATDEILREQQVRGKEILIFCGKGNNGGDGFVAARLLAKRHAHVTVVLAEGEPKTPDARVNWRLLTEDGSLHLLDFKEKEQAKALPALLDQADIIVDAIYGTGFHGSLPEPIRTIARAINQAKARKYALDIPSGLSGDSGEADQDAVRAHVTLAFHAKKPVHQKKEAKGYCGEIRVVRIGIDDLNLAGL